MPIALGVKTVAQAEHAKEPAGTRESLERVPLAGINRYFLLTELAVPVNDLGKFAAVDLRQRDNFHFSDADFTRHDGYLPKGLYLIVMPANDFVKRTPI
jgi:hypothetical protein